MCRFCKGMGLQADQTTIFIIGRALGLWKGGRRDSHSSDLLSGLYTSYTAHLHRDKALLKRLLKVEHTG